MKDDGGGDVWLGIIALAALWFLLSGAAVEIGAIGLGAVALMALISGATRTATGCGGAMAALVVAVIAAALLVVVLAPAFEQGHLP